ncbi:hypothetical protein [Nocardia carnea]|uniref:hypothetical protein n=1 Tax=Nocardia carnea TaxID=37328 RepID=UPI0024567051|nr:hypothetical protein [Nocardia carnea]
MTFLDERAVPETLIGIDGQRLRRVFPGVASDVLAAAIECARNDLAGVPAEWLPELTERLTWWRLSTATRAGGPAVRRR